MSCSARGEEEVLQRRSTFVSSLHAIAVMIIPLTSWSRCVTFLTCRSWLEIIHWAMSITRRWVMSLRTVPTINMNVFLNISWPWLVIIIIIIMLLLSSVVNKVNSIISLQVHRRPTRLSLDRYFDLDPHRRRRRRRVQVTVVNVRVLLLCW